MRWKLNYFYEYSFQIYHKNNFRCVGFQTMSNHAKTRLLQSAKNGESLTICPLNRKLLEFRVTISKTFPPINNTLQLINNKSGVHIVTLGLLVLHTIATSKSIHALDFLSQIRRVIEPVFSAIRLTFSRTFDHYSRAVGNNGSAVAQLLNTGHIIEHSITLYTAIDWSPKRAKSSGSLYHFSSEQIRCLRSVRVVVVMMRRRSVLASRLNI